MDGFNSVQSCGVPAGLVAPALPVSLLSVMPVNESVRLVASYYAAYESYLELIGQFVGSASSEGSRAESVEFSDGDTVSARGSEVSVGSSSSTPKARRRARQRRRRAEKAKAVDVGSAATYTDAAVVTSVGVGYCYLGVISDEFAAEAAAGLGERVTFSRLLDSPAAWLSSAAASMRVSRTGPGLYHVSSAGMVPFSTCVASIVAKAQVTCKPGTIGARYAGLLASPTMVDKAPRMDDLCGAFQLGSTDTLARFGFSLSETAVDHRGARGFGGAVLVLPGVSHLGRSQPPPGFSAGGLVRLYAGGAAVVDLFEGVYLVHGPLMSSGCEDLAALAVVVGPTGLRFTVGLSDLSWVDPTLYGCFRGRVCDAIATGAHGLLYLPGSGLVGGFSSVADGLRVATLGKVAASDVAVLNSDGVCALPADFEPEALSAVGWAARAESVGGAVSLYVGLGSWAYAAVYSGGFRTVSVVKRWDTSDCSVREEWHSVPNPPAPVISDDTVNLVVSERSYFDPVRVPALITRSPVAALAACGSYYAWCLRTVNTDLGELSIRSMDDPGVPPAGCALVCAHDTERHKVADMYPGVQWHNVCTIGKMQGKHYRHVWFHRFDGGQGDAFVSDPKSLCFLLMRFHKTFVYKRQREYPDDPLAKWVLRSADPSRRVAVADVASVGRSVEKIL